MRKKLLLLSDIARDFNAAGIRWAVGASAMLYLRCLAEEFNDIDLFVAEEDIESAKEILLRHGQMLPPRDNSAFSTKHFLEFEMDSLGIDLIAGFAMQRNGKTCHFPMEEKHDRVRVLDAIVPLQSLGRWRECYAAMGRDAKVKMLDEAIAARCRPWLDWAVEMQAIAQNGLAYGKDIYDIERYEQLRRLSAEMLAYQTEIPPDKIRTLFCGESGYQTPKLDTRAAIFQDGKILLVREKNGKWSLPGGWVDVNESIASNTIKEIWEEAGLHAECLRLIALQDRNRHNLPYYAYGICKIFMLCRSLGGDFRPNSETTASRYFGLDELPPLAEEKNTREQIVMCFNAQADENWKVQFD